MEKSRNKKIHRGRSKERGSIAVYPSEYHDDKRTGWGPVGMKMIQIQRRRTYNIIRQKISRLVDEQGMKAPITTPCRTVVDPIILPPTWTKNRVIDKPR
jgi:hypothetical protein